MIPSANRIRDPHVVVIIDVDATVLLTTVLNSKSFFDLAGLTVTEVFYLRFVTGEECFVQNCEKRLREHS